MTALRGGGRIGSLDAEMFSNIQLLAIGACAVVAAFPFMNMKLLGTVEDVAWRSWFALSQLWLFLVLLAAKFQGGMDTIVLSRLVTSWHAMLLPVLAYQHFCLKTVATMHPIYVLGVLVLLGAYMGFA